MRIDHEIPVALRRAYLALHRATDSVFAKYGVTADQFVLMASLARDHALTQRQLASRMSSDPSTVRAMLVLLEKNDLVRRESHPADARAKTVALTPAGKRKFQQLWKVGQHIRDTMYDALQPHEVTTLIRLLNQVSESLNSAGDESSDQLPSTPARR
ncbi:MAG: MarR family transcriptional regulator [Pirellulales bacterium]